MTYSGSGVHAAGDHLTIAAARSFVYTPMSAAGSEASAAGVGGGKGWDTITAVTALGGTAAGLPPSSS